MVSVDQENGVNILYCNARSVSGCRVQAVSFDNGAVFHDGQLVHKLVEPKYGCHGSVIGFPAPFYQLKQSQHFLRRLRSIYTPFAVSSVSRSEVSTELPPTNMGGDTCHNADLKRVLSARTEVSAAHNRMSCIWTGGHATPVLCAGVSSESEHVVATGAEGGELTLWSHDGLPVSKLHISADDDVTCIAFSPSTPSMLYASHGQSVSVLDTRNLKAAVTELTDVGEEEINWLSVNESGGLLAVADDSGAVRVVDLQLKKVIRTLRKHDNICSSVTFRPHRPQSLVSAGLDMQVLLWNLPKVRPQWTYSLQDSQEDDAHPQKAGQMFNPPLAHCIDVASCGNVFACAAEDGCIHLLRVSEDSRLKERGMFKAHCQGASQAHFISFLSHPYWLATGGNDGLVALWDLSEDALVANERKRKSHKKRQKARTKTASQGSDKNQKQQMSGAEAGSASSSLETQGKTVPKLSFNHGEKVNWVCPAVLKGKPSLLVADQSSSPSVYSLDGL
ncbi:hypothetical protein QQF64_007985 [Cirrhinus molitorella]|uniref:WD repeat domain 53 n=1 Tax=Cirrhinus molitorella TaxID=172907 RepID=A0ABR3M4V2_9TELE